MKGNIEVRSKKPEARNQKRETRNKVQEGGVCGVRTAVILALLIVGGTIAQTGNVTLNSVTGQTWQIPMEARCYCGRISSSRTMG